MTKLISKNEMMRVLLDACPSFEPRWNEFLAEWAGEPEAPVYLALADFARHLIGMFASGERSSFPSIFSAVKQLLLEGDGFVQKAAIVGLLESLQNTNLHSTTTPEQFDAFLGPVSKVWWEKLNRFWDGDATALR